jgi:hypothetical protein
MSTVTSQQLTRFYEQYRETEVTFNRQVIAATGLIPRNLYIRVVDRQLPCTVFSSSLASARVIANVKANFFLDLRRPNTRLALHWCFKRPDKLEPMTFFVACHATGFTHFNVQNPGVQMMTLEFTQRPPNDLIEILGTLLEANWNSQQRREERVLITPENMKKLGMESRDALLLIEGAARHCILRDLSFIGAEVLASGLTDSDTGRVISLKIAKGEQAVEMTLPGTITRVEDAGGRKDIMVVAIEYSTDTPISYKLLINSFLTSARKARKDAEDAPGSPADVRPPDQVPPSPSTADPRHDPEGGPSSHG